VRNSTAQITEEILILARTTSQGGGAGGAPRVQQIDATQPARPEVGQQWVGGRALLGAPQGTLPAFHHLGMGRRAVLDAASGEATHKVLPAPQSAPLEPASSPPVPQRAQSFAGLPPPALSDALAAGRIAPERFPLALAHFNRSSLLF